MATIRHELNLLNTSISTTNDTSGTHTNANEKISVNTSKFSGTITYYLEFVVESTWTQTRLISLVNESGASALDVTIPAGPYSKTLFRKEITNTSRLSTDVHIQIAGTFSGSGTVILSAGRVVVIQDTGSDPVTNSEDQYEIGANETGKTNTTSSPLNAPKLWYYDDRVYDGTLSFEAEVVYGSSSSMSNRTITLEEDDGNFNLWHTAATIVSAGTATTATRVRVSFTPKNGRNYRLAAVSSSSMDTYDIYCGKIIVTQVSNEIIIINSANLAGNASPTRPRELGQTFTIFSPMVIESFGFYEDSNLLVGASGKFIGKLYSGYQHPTLGYIWNLIASGTGGDIGAVNIGQVINFYPRPAYILPTGSGYMVSCEIVERDDLGEFSTNYFVPTDKHYASGVPLFLNTNIWQNAFGDTNFDLLVNITGTTGLYKFCSEYLMVNAQQTATGFRTGFYGLFNSGDWSGANNIYITSHDGNLTTTASKLQFSNDCISPSSSLLDITGGLATGNNLVFGTPTGTRPSGAITSSTISQLEYSGAGTVKSGVAQGFTCLTDMIIFGAKWSAGFNFNASGGFYCKLVSGHGPSGAYLMTSSVATGSGISGHNLTIGVPGITMYFPSGIQFNAGTTGTVLLYRTTSGSLQGVMSSLYVPDTPRYSGGSGWTTNDNVNWSITARPFLMNVLTAINLPTGLSGILGSSLLRL